MCTTRLPKCVSCVASRWGVLLCVLGQVFACTGGSGSSGSDGPGASAIVDATVGVEGGTVSLGDAAMVIPSGALTRDVAISVFEDEPALPLPVGYGAAGPALSITPHGQTFLEPVTLQLPYTGDDTDLAVVVIANPANPEWEFLVPRSTAGGVATVEITHLSTWVVVRVTQGRTGDTITTTLADGGAVVADEQPDPAVGYRPQIDVVVDDTRTVVRFNAGKFQEARNFEVVLPGVGARTYGVGPGGAAVALSDQGVRYIPQSGSFVIERFDERIGGTFQIEVCPVEDGCAVTVTFAGTFDAARETRQGMPQADLSVVLEAPIAREDGMFDIPYVVTNSGDGPMDRAERAAHVGLFVSPPKAPFGAGQAPDFVGVPLDGLAPGESVGGTITAPAGALEGDTALYGVIDNDLVVPERDEGNNVSPPFFFAKGPDLVPRLTTATATYGVLFVEYELGNEGARGFAPATPSDGEVRVTLCPDWTADSCRVAETHRVVRPRVGVGEQYHGAMIVYVGELGADAALQARLSISGIADTNPFNNVSPTVVWSNDFHPPAMLDSPDEGTASAPLDLGAAPIEHFGTAHDVRPDDGDGGTDYFRLQLTAGTYVAGLFGMNDPPGIDNFTTGFRIWHDAALTHLLKECDPRREIAGAGVAQCAFEVSRTQQYFMSIREVIGEPGSPYLLVVRPLGTSNLTVAIQEADYDRDAGTLQLHWVVRNTGTAPTGYDGLAFDDHRTIPLYLWAQLEQLPSVLQSVPERKPLDPAVVIEIDRTLEPGEEVSGFHVFRGLLSQTAGTAAAQVNGYTRPAAHPEWGLDIDDLATLESDYDDNGTRLAWGPRSDLDELYAVSLDVARSRIGSEHFLDLDYTVRTLLGGRSLADPNPTCFTIAAWSDYHTGKPPERRVRRCAPELPVGQVRGRLRTPTRGQQGGVARVLVDADDEVWEMESADNAILREW